MSSSGSPPESGFIPRKEFIRDQRPTTNAFCLLAISGSSLIRLYSFPQSTIAALRRLFDQWKLMTMFREDVALKLCEFTLEGKPWANPKNVESETLLVTIMAIIYQHGYTYLSTIDYGRERDDRLAMAFSKPIPLSTTSRSGSPMPSSPMHNASSSTLSYNAPRAPFALSFLSATLLRVIAPPLHSTPAILQAVRGSWPRGVVSEKKVGDAAFEFKLKGYKWFQEDTFATDSLHHILSLLSNLDTYNFSLLTSVSLSNNRSRVKDLWIFTGPAGPAGEGHSLGLPESPAPSIINSELKHGTSPELPPYASGSGLYQHRKQGSAPTGSQSPQHHAYAQPPVANIHTRAATEYVYPRNYSPTNPGPVPPSPLSSHSAGPNFLRKPAPRAQLPVSVGNDSPHEIIQEFRANLPSTISSSIENMTGIGSSARTPDRFYSTSPFGIPEDDPSETPGRYSPHHRTPSPPPASRPPSPPMTPASPNFHRPRSSLGTLSKSPPLRVPHSPSPPASHVSSPVPSRSSSPATLPPSFTSHPVNYQNIPPTPGTPSYAGNPALLGPGVFRDSAFSTNTANTEGSCDIPITWTGSSLQIDGQSQQSPPSSYDHRVSSTPMPPGGWQDTPDEDKTVNEVASIPSQDHTESETEKGPSTPLHEVLSRVDSPELTHQALRKSEAGLVGMIQEPASSTSVPGPVQKGKEKEGAASGTGSGWVLVNIDGNNQMPSPAAHNKGGGAQTGGLNSGIERHSTELPSAKEAASTALKTGVPSPTPEDHARSKMGGKPGHKASMSPAAKALVIIDAVDHHKPKSKAKAKSGEGESSASGLRRLFSSRKANSNSSLDGPAANGAAASSGSGTTQTITNSVVAKVMANSEHGKRRKTKGSFRDKLRKKGAAEDSKS